MSAAEQAVEFHTADGRTIISARGTFYVEDKITLEHTIFGDDFATLESLVTNATPKQTEIVGSWVRVIMIEPGRVESELRDDVRQEVRDELGLDSPLSKASTPT